MVKCQNFEWRMWFNKGANPRPLSIKIGLPAGVLSWASGCVQLDLLQDACCPRSWWPSDKNLAQRAADRQSLPAFFGGVTFVTQKLISSGYPARCLVRLDVRSGWPGVSMLWLYEIEGWSATFASVWKHIHLSERLHPWYRLCLRLECWAVRKPTILLAGLEVCLCCQDLSMQHYSFTFNLTLTYCQ